MEALSIGTLAVVIINLLGFAFTYGRLNQKVDDMARRIDRLERKIDNGKKG